MANAIDLTGRQFGSLIVLTSVRKRTPHRYHAVLWQCQCACGTTPLVHGDALLDGSVTSCSTCMHPAALIQHTRRALPDDHTTNVCTACQGEPQPLDAFSFNGASRYGRAIYCKRCMHERKKAHRAQRNVST